MAQPLVKRGNVTDVKSFLTTNRERLAKAMPAHVSADRLMRVAIQAVSNSVKLQQCSVNSLIAAIVQCSLLGLEPNGPLGEAYLVPFKGKVVLVPGYRGLINLARRTGLVTVVYAHVVHEADEFYYEYGLNPKLVHKPASGERGDKVGVYAVYKTRDGAEDFEVMDPAQVEKIRQRSPARDDGPWVTDEDEMWKKSAIKRLSKRMPMGVEQADAHALDDMADAGTQDNAPVMQDLGFIEPVGDEPAPLEDGGKPSKDFPGE